MGRYTTVLFDLDGTLLKSDEGIINSIKYALQKMGRPDVARDKLRAFIGPPLVMQLTQCWNFTESEADMTVKYYRERYSAIGLFESEPYPGVREMLDVLKKRGCVLAVASSKPEPYVIRILEHYCLAGYFDVMVGATLDEKRMSKADVIESALKRLHMEDKRDGVIMVGDKKYDVNGARKAGIPCIAVLYGFAEAGELEAAAPFKTAGSVKELTNILLSLSSP